VTGLKSITEGACERTRHTDVARRGVVRRDPCCVYGEGVG
jgi:hypothetical protein